MGFVNGGALPGEFHRREGAQFRAAPGGGEFAVGDLLQGGGLGLRKAEVVGGALCFAERARVEAGGIAGDDEGEAVVAVAAGVVAIMPRSQVDKLSL